jgi:hypothetical protein
MAITFIEGADMSEAKTPLPGEYWVSDDGSLIRIVGVKLNGGVIYENQAGFSFQFNSMIQWRHEPRCTGFDWVEPKLLTPGEGYELLPVGTVLECGDEFLIGKEWVMTGNYGEDYSVLRNTYRRKIKPVESWPKYYRGDNWCSINAYVRFDDEYHEAIWVAADGTERVFHGERFHTIPERIEENSWREITEAEALGRVKPESDPPPFSKPFTNPRSGMGIRKEPVETLQQLCEFCTQPLTDDGRCLFSPCVACDIQADIEPVESPDDWVEITNRDHKLRAGIDEFRNSHEWAYVRDSHGKTARQAGFLNVRCRRKDLPVLVTPEPCAMCGDVSCDCDCYKYAVEATGCPIESPDDWVEITDHGHVVRSYIDQVLVSAYGGHSWVYAVISGGSCLGDLGIRKCRCRRRDLPVQKLCTCPTLDGIPVTGSACPIHGLTSCELTTAAKRVPVRLWINGDDGVVFQSEVHVNAGDQEIKHDADGFYVTEGGLHGRSQ